MKTHWKRLIVATISLGIAMTSTAFAATVSMNLHYNGENHAYSAKKVTILVDEKELVPTDMPAVIVDGRTMLPMRLIAQELGCDVLWNEDTKQAFVISDDYTIAFTIDSKDGIKNGTGFEMDVPAMVINDRTMLPVRALANALDLAIIWDDPTRTVSISQKKEEPKEIETPSYSGDVIQMASVSMPSSKTAEQVFTIQASGAILDYEQVYVDETKVVLDIHNATSALADRYTATNSSLVSAVRTAQHTAQNGNPYTRVVLDLSGKREYTVTQSADGTKIYVTFEKVVVQSMSLKSVSGRDRIIISADGEMGANVFLLSNPPRVVVDIANADSKLKNTFDTGDLSFVTEARTGMFAEDTLRIVLEVGQLSDFTWEERDGDLTITVQKSTLKGIAYDSADGALYLEKSSDFYIEDIRMNDRYLDGYFEVRLPGSFERDYGYGTLHIGAEDIQTLQISTSGGETRIRFNQNRISAYEVDENEDYYIIYIKNPKDVYDKVLLLDAGHGGSDPGAVANGLREKDLNLNMVLLIQEHLAGTGIQVYLTRDDDSRPENIKRAATANEIADFMVSIHMNATTNAVANGTETLYVGNETSSAKLTSKKAAEVIQSHLIQAINRTNRGIKERPDLIILNSTTVPTVLVEVCFLTNPGDALMIADEKNQEIAAKAIADAIIELMDDYKLR